ncbi:helix-turn-helix domain-containing protein [Streptomyces sp. NPDC094468]|uniref:helix-turn-helix domain-containing protein n=1 Tax=Streptomyces sp. NPDC094468 TaxID=3366066 RepID=UPI00380E94F0
MIERAFALLASFDGDHRAQTLAELAQRSGIPRSSALRLARTLTGVGALERPTTCAGCSRRSGAGTTPWAARTGPGP